MKKSIAPAAGYTDNAETPTWAIAEETYNPDEPESTWTEYTGPSATVSLSLSMSRTDVGPAIVEAYLFTDVADVLTEVHPAANHQLARLTIETDEFSQVLMLPSEARQLAAHLVFVADQLDEESAPGSVAQVIGGDR